MRRSWTRAVLLAIGLSGLAISTTGCGSLSYSGKKSFSEWYIGPVGYAATVERSRFHRKPNSFKVGRILQRRVPIYGHFRTPELIWNPTGWHQFPARIVYPSRDEARRFSHLARHRIDKFGNEKPVEYLSIDDQPVREGEPLAVPRGTYVDFVGFTVGEAGLLDTLIPYRVFSSKASALDASITKFLSSPFYVLFNALGIVVRAPVYVTHDLAKTLLIPAALIHYNL